MLANKFNEEELINWGVDIHKVPVELNQDYSTKRASEKHKAKWLISDN
jgi:hypothetical protein